MKNYLGDTIPAIADDVESLRQGFDINARTDPHSIHTIDADLSGPIRTESRRYPGGISETEILLAYGGVHFASKMGQLAGNHFITLTSGLENLTAFGKTVLWKGAQKIRFEEV